MRLHCTCTCQNKGCDRHDHFYKCFHNKKACLTGVAQGRAGNLRGMDHLTNIFHHLKMNVLHFKIPISQVHLLLDESGKLNNQEMIKLIEIQIDLLMEF